MISEGSGALCSRGVRWFCRMGKWVWEIEHQWGGGQRGGDVWGSDGNAKLALGRLAGTLAPTVLGVFLVLTLVQGRAEPRLGGLENGDVVSERLEGELLIRELSCARCHSELATRFPARQSPDLSAIGSRVSLDYLIRLLSAPHQAEPGTVMPDVLARLPEADRANAVDGLAHFLSSLQSTPRETEPERSGSAARGQALFESIGCVVCHPKSQLEGESGYLQRLGEKYSHGSLMTFLMDPLTIRPGSRMPSLHLKHAEAVDIATYLRNGSPTSSVNRPVNEAWAKRGKELFAQVGCAACHEGTIGGSHQRVVSVPIRKERLDQGCLSNAKGAWPDFSLSPQQRQAIRVALGSNPDLERHEAIELAMRQFNCVQCHRRGDYGGVTERADEFFQSRDPNLGEQGRLPPSLDGVGAKLKPEWLRKIVVQGADVRPYLLTRMPRFSGTEIDRLIENLLLEDPTVPVPAVSFREANKAKGQGRTLAGTEGLSCLTCHTFKGIQTGAMGAIDLSVMSQRLTRSWFQRYLMNPRRFNETTLMPEFWPAGRSSFTEIYEGEAQRQIEALWLYTSDGYGMGAPRGVRREPMRLVADSAEAVMLRRSFRGIGKRGIGVGYPGSVNLIFNAEQLSLALLWRGDFLDPAGVWRSQGHGTARPLGRNPIPLANVPELQFLTDVAQPWPVAMGRSDKHQFRGYQLDEFRRPTFEYRVGSIAVSDRFVPLADGGGDPTGLRRQLRLRGPSERGPLVMKLAAAEGLKLVEPGLYEVPGLLRIRLPEGDAGFLYEGTDGFELRVPIRFDADSGIGVLVLDYLF